MSPSIECAAPCRWRTYGKYKRTSTGKKVLNPNKRDKGTCSLDRIKVAINGLCCSYQNWDEDEENE